jgi:type VI secretion system protein ImpE
MNANDYYGSGQLRDAIQAQTAAVKADAADQGKRTFLFELLAYAGELDRARRQIDALRSDDLGREAAVMSYRKLLDAEAARRRLFREGVAPRFLADPPQHVRLRLEAVGLLREDRQAEAAEVLARAVECTPSVKGTLNGNAFEGLRDADDLLAGVLEVFAQDAYFWVPLEQVEALALNAPKYPRDLLWPPARLEVKGAAGGDVFLPALYPGSHEHPDDLIKLGRKTDWVQKAQGPVLGVGQRTFLVGEEAVSLLEWRSLEIA